MPRWVSLLLLCSLSFVGGAANVWADAVTDVDVHETAPCIEVAAEGEEEATQDGLEGTPEADPLVAVLAGRKVRVAEPSIPPVPPPR